jgi:amino acid transporter
MRPAVWLSYATGVAMAVPVIVLAVGPFVTGNISNHAVNGNAMSSTLTGVFGESASTWHQFGLIMVWLYVLGWSTYGPEAPATFAPEFIDTKNDTRKAIISTGAFNVFLSALLPLAVVGTLGYSAIAGDLTGIVYMIDVLKAIVGDFFGGVLVVCLCAGLLLSMNTATMDGSRALFGMARDGLTVKQLSVLNSHHVPGRAMTLDMVMNVCLLMFFPSIFFVLAAGNLGYILSHVLALSGVLLLRKDRPAWPRPIKLGPIWMVLAGAFAVYNLLLIIFGLAFLKLTGYAWNYAFTDPSAFTNRIILVGVLVLVAGVAGYVIGQRQVGRPFRWTDPSDESPTAEAYQTAGMAIPAIAGD